MIPNDKRRLNKLWENRNNIDGLQAQITTINNTIETIGGGADQNIAVFFQTGTLTTGTGVSKMAFTLGARIIRVRAAVGTSPTGANLIVDVNKNGTTIFTTQANRPTVVAADADGVGEAAVPDETTISVGEYLTVDIDQVGSTVAGADLTVSVEWRPV